MKELEKFRFMHDAKGGFWKNGQYMLTAEEEQEFNALHQDIIKLMKNNPEYPQKRVRYTVAGYSEKHGYFRNRYSTHKDFEAAKNTIRELKKNPEWNLPTVLVKETWLLSRTNFRSILDFIDDKDFGGSSDFQQVIEKSMMGNRSLRWEKLGVNQERVTY